MSPLERRCRRLLLAYPAAYRAERGDEIIGTLLESTPRGRLGRREAWALLTGGLRVRAEAHRRLSTATNLRLAALYGVTLWLAMAALPGLWYTALPRTENSMYVNGELVSRTVTWNYPPLGQLLFHLVTMAGLVALMVVAWWPRPRVIAVLGAVAALGALPWRWSGSPTWLLITALVVLLARGPARMPRSWLGPLALFAAGQTLAQFGFMGFLGGISMLSTLLTLAALAAVLLWTFLDGRPLFGLGLLLVMIVLEGEVRLLVIGGSTESAQSLVLPAIALALLIPAMLRVRRQAAL